jgi:hypothetical protein
MFRPLFRSLVMVAVLTTAATVAQAQLFPRGCASCGQTPLPLMTGALPAPVSYGYDPCNICGPAVAINPCVVCAQPVAVMQPITQTVYREVPVTKYRPVQKTVQRPVVKTVYEQRPVTAYRQVMETRTVEVPTTTYQTITECQPRIANRSYWQTVYQPVPKMSPCQYDPNPTLLGWINRTAYATRMALTPNYIRQRQYVPNVVAFNVPVTRTVAIPTTRQVTYNVARLEPYETTQTVAVAKVEYEETTVTAYEPYTENVTMAVGTTTTYAFVGPSAGGTATALAPVPDTTIQSRSAQNPTPAAGGSSSTPQPARAPDDGLFKPLSHPQPEPTPIPGYFDARQRQELPQSERGTPTAVATGWRPRRTTEASETAPHLPQPQSLGEQTGVAVVSTK